MIDKLFSREGKTLEFKRVLPARQVTEPAAPKRLESRLESNLVADEPLP